MARIGILGGTFNPPHNGHVELAKAALRGLGLDCLLVIPAKAPPHKEIVDEPGAEARFDLCEAGFAGLDGAEVSRLELDREGPSWMVDTVGQVRDEEPDAEVFLILGEDAALSLPEWKAPEQIVANSTIAWVPRADGESRGDVGEVVRQLGSSVSAVEVPMEPVAISSTEIRGLVGDGLDIIQFVPPAVASLISERGLYHRKSV